MGKGGCFDFYDQSVNCIRSIFACLCCFLCIGPVLIIVGIVVLLAKNNFDSDVDSYKTAITKFQSRDKAVMLSMNAQVGLNTFTITQPQVPIKGVNVDKVPTATSVVLVSYNTLDLTFARSASLSAANLTAAVVSVPSSDSYDGMATGGVSCSSSSSSSRSSCSNSDWNNACQSKYGSNAYWSGGSMCLWYQYWRYACVPLSISTASFGADMMGSCDYINLPMGNYQQSGFGYQPLDIYATAMPSLDNQHTVKFMANDDPYIVASRITKGTMDFGLTAAQQRTLGIALLAIGILITIFVGCILGVLRQRMTSNPQNGTAMYGAFGRQYPYAQPQQQQPYGVQYQAMPPQQPYQAQPCLQQPAQQPYAAQPYQQPQQQPYAQPQQQPYAQPYGQPYQAAPPPQQQQGYYAGGPQPGYGQPNGF